MNYNLILRIIGILLLFLGWALLTPLPFSYYYNSGDQSAFFISSGVCFITGALAFLIFRRKKNEDLRPKEGFAVVTLGWLSLSLFGALPFVISGAIPSYTDAFFETMSGFTTTGASILSDIEGLPKGILFWRSFTHWLGGMGIIVLSVAILPFLGVGGMQLFKAEVPGPIADKLSPRVTETAKILWGVYLLFTIAETGLLMLGGMNLFDSLTHTFGTLATGGFSTKNTSVASFNSAYFDYIIIVFMIIAGTNFSLHFRILKGNFSSIYKNDEFKFFISIIVIATIIISIDIFGSAYDSVFDTLRYSLFQVVSLLTTTGYGTADYEQWPLSSQVILILLMFVGGCAGSTGGGMKVLRVFILVQFVYSEIKRLIHPNAVVPVRLGNIDVDRQTMANIAGFFIVFIMIAAFSVLIFTLFGLDLNTSIGAVVATINNIGPGIGMVGPTENYGFMPEIVKWYLSFLMLAGRLEIFTVIILLSPTYWKK